MSEPKDGATTVVDQVSPYENTSNDSSHTSKNDLFNDKPDLSAKGITNYLTSRWSTLWDLPLYHTDEKWYKVVNPFPALKGMTWMEWNFYLCGYCGWAIDAMDFFCVSVAVPEIAVTLGVSVTDITWGMTLVLMFRSVGAVIFGIASDRYGRKWTFIVLCALFVVVEIGTGLVQTYEQFLGVRALFGILMGSMLPVTMVTALEVQPVVARSVLSGFFLPGYSFGYILAMVFYRAFQGTFKENEGWRSLFWFSGGLSVLLVVWRFFLPESPVFLKMKAKKKRFNEKNKVKHKYIDTSVFQTLKTEWLLFIYLVLLYSGWNFTTHGAQDLYVTMITNQFGVDFDTRTIIVVVSNLGGMIGGIIMGSFSELLGRRLTVIICMIWCCTLVYPSFFNADKNWWAYVLLNGGIIGAWGIGPIYLLEMVNKANRTLLAGLAYQLGNLVSSASATIEARLGEEFQIEGAAPGVYDYGKVMCIFAAAVQIYMGVCMYFGPERFHANMHVEDSDDELLEEGELESDKKETAKN